MDIDGKVAVIHTVAGIVAGYISFILYPAATAPGNNQVLAVIIALIILYAVGQISERMFGKEEVGGLSGWFWSGVVPYFFVWIIVWVIFANMK